MTVLTGISKGVFRAPSGEIFFDLVELLGRFGMGDSLLSRIRLKAALIGACRDAGQPFSIIERLAGFKRMDMIIHFSIQDLQRNMARYVEMSPSPLDTFEPGWRVKVDAGSHSTTTLRAALLDHWLELVRGLDMEPSRGELIRASKGQRLYWLMFVSRHDLPDKLWDDIRNIGGQTEFSF